MDNSADIKEIQKGLATIHYEPNRVDYTVNQFELELIEQTGNSIWKDVFLASLFFGVPCSINAWSNYSKLTDKVFNTEIFLNSLFGGIGIIIAIISCLIWQKNKKKFSKIIEQIKSKPAFKIPTT